jgi:hypothetical protein
MNSLTRAAAACVLAIGLAAPALACMPPPYVEDFRKHPAEVYAGERKAIDFDSHPIAAALSEADKEQLRKSVAAGPNFAGAYRIVYAKCGEKCSALLVVSLASGKIFRVPVADNSYANFRPNSRFLVIRGASGEESFFVFDGREFQPTRAQSES